jgi:hypothetical protein
MYRTSVHPSNLLDMPRTNAALPPSPGMPLVHPFTSHFNLLASSRPVLCSALLCPAPFDKPRTSEYPPSSPTPSLAIGLGVVSARLGLDVRVIVFLVVRFIAVLSLLVVVPHVAR